MARNARIAEASTHPDDGTDATVMHTRKTIRNHPSNGVTIRKKRI